MGAAVCELLYVSCLLTRSGNCIPSHFAHSLILLVVGFKHRRLDV